MNRLIVTLALFVAAGAPLALYSWHVLTDALAGHADGISTSIAVSFVAAFLVLARVLGRRLARLEGI